MKKLLVGAAVTLSMFTGTCSAWERVTSTSQLGDKNYIYEIVMDNTFKYSGTWSLNMNNPSNGSNVFMWKSLSDDDQTFRIDGNHIRRATQGFCLNAYNPQQGSNVNTWVCDDNDSDQYWGYSVINAFGDTYVMFEANDSGYCMNAHKPYYYSNVNLYQCDSSDHEQMFSVIREYNPAL